MSKSILVLGLPVQIVLLGFICSGFMRGLCLNTHGYNDTFNLPHYQAPRQGCHDVAMDAHCFSGVTTTAPSL